MKLTIKTKLIALLVVPLAGLAYYGGTGFVTQAHIATQMGNIVGLSDLAVRISSLVHETQKERGLTAAFLGSKGEKFGDELAAQRKATDQKLEPLNAYLVDFDTSKFGDLGNTLDKAVGQLRQVKEKRQAVSSLIIPVKDAIGYYTAMNSLFLDAIGAMAKQSTDAQTTVAIKAYVSFLKGKERAGIERAVMANTFASDAFGPGMFRKFVSLVTAQDIYLGEFALTASPSAVGSYQQRMKDPAVTEVAQFRQVAIDKAGEGGFGVDAGQWFVTITKKINLLKEVEDELSVQLSELAVRGQETAEAEELFIGILTLVLIIGVAAGGFFTMRSIIGPISALVDTMKDIAEGDGDLGKRVDGDRKDELGELGRWFNTFVDNIQDIIAAVNGVSQEVASGASEISASNEEISGGVQEQNQQVLQISSAVEQMSASIVEVARKSNDAATTAAESGRVAQEGGQVVSQTIEGMRTISEAVTASAASVSELGKRGDQIGQIIEVINDIADQTNLLALNAAIEAARAGEHGRGFAVVADEVRKLADRTTKATEEIAVSIKAIQTETSEAVRRMETGTEQVNTGVVTATQAGDALQQIVAKAQDVAGMIQSIAAAAEEQSTASEQVAHNIEKVSAVTEQTAQGTTQAAQAASQLLQRAERMNGLVARFKNTERRQNDVGPPTGIAERRASRRDGDQIASSDDVQDRLKESAKQFKSMA